MTVTVIGAGLAGVEAAHALSRHGVKVKLHEMKPAQYSPAHKYSGFAELVCSNSLKADAEPAFANPASPGSRVLPRSASALLKAEMRLLGSLTLQVAEQTKVAAGGALAVDRERFSDEITRRILADPNIEVITGEVANFPERNAIIATGPLTSDKFAQSIAKHVGHDALGVPFLGFYDAAAPIVTAESIDMSKAFMASRYGKGDADYINCPFTREEYEVFYNALINAEIAPLHDFDVPQGSPALPDAAQEQPRSGVAPKFYEGCIPVEILAKRGIDSLRFGCMKPVGLHYPAGYPHISAENGQNPRPWGVLQLRAENAEKSMYNIVGFQTNLKFGEQKRVFRLIPGLENAEFVRYGVMHRNTFINSPRLLDSSFKLSGSENIYFAGQITGVEGYMESAASGIISGLAMAGRLPDFPRSTMLGALTNYISTPNENFQPMGANMGLLPPLTDKIRNKQERYEKLAERALCDLRGVL
jgi:methylenetetrahydrofolate--tRNA-(uracil-5-)-methyltransferase